MMDRADQVVERLRQLQAEVDAAGGRAAAALRQARYRVVVEELRHSAALLREWAVLVEFDRRRR